jgi:hypothetical protein
MFTEALLRNGRYASLAGSLPSNVLSSTLQYYAFVSFTRTGNSQDSSVSIVSKPLIGRLKFHSRYQRGLYVIASRPAREPTEPPWALFGRNKAGRGWGWLFISMQCRNESGGGGKRNLPCTLNYTYLFTELSPSWGAANCAATQELSSIS